MQNDSPKAKVQCNTKIIIIYYIHIHYTLNSKGQNDSPKAKVQCNTKIIIIYYIHIHYTLNSKGQSITIITISY